MSLSRFNFLIFVFVIFFLICSYTSFTKPSLSFSIFSVKNIIFSKFMTIFAMCFFCVICARTKPSKYIFSMANSFKMFRVYANFISTKMINFIRRWYFSNKKLVTKPISFNNRVSSSKMKNPITSSICRRVPFPTTIFFFVNFFNKSFHVRWDTPFIYKGQAWLN